MNNDQKEVVFVSFIILSPLFMTLILALMNS
jgi:hypothetical protein